MEGLAKPKAIIICGPTASGKSSLALSLCKKFNGEIVSADSMQIYQNLVVGTAALTKEELGGIPQHMVGFLPPEQRYSVAQYLQDAKKALEDISSRGKLPVVCGGTGLYITSLVNGISFTPESPPEELRLRLALEWEQQGAAAMLQKLQQVDPEHAKKLHENDKKRILRSLEQWELTNLNMAQREEESRKTKPEFDFLSIGIDYSSRELLYSTIEERVDAMLSHQLLEEARWVYENRDNFKTAVQAIGYKELFPYFAGENTLEHCTNQLKQATRNYAKRQRTWFLRMPQIHWIMADDQEHLEKAEEMTAAFLKELPPDGLSSKQ